MTNSSNSFDARAKEWDSPSKIARAKALAEAIRQRLPAKQRMKAMEFGCGTGLLSFELQGVFEKITLVDTSAGMLEVLKDKISKTKNNHFHPLLKDIFTEPIEEKFDVIFTAMTLHHIGDTRTALRILKSSLLTGGVLFVADLDQEDGSFHLGAEQVHHGFVRNELRQMAQDEGFLKIEFSTAYEMVKQKNLFFKKKYPIFLMRAE